MNHAHRGKGHCCAQLPSAGAARGVKSHVDKTEVTLTQRQEGIQIPGTRWARGGPGERAGLHGASWLNRSGGAAEQQGRQAGGPYGGNRGDALTGFVVSHGLD